jgi:ABC-2 type transport system ATP-binding protein
VLHSLKVTPPRDSQPALRIRSLRKQYGDVVAVDSLDLDVYAGECFGLLGPNGAGKTTTVEICEGLLDPGSGSLEILGRTWRSHERELRQLLGVQLQATEFSEKLTVAETLRMFRSFFVSGMGVEEAIQLVQLEPKRDSRVGTLSGGQKQRLAIACALIGDPQFLFLDEPTTGLDPQSRRQLWELVEQLKGAGRTILLTTHYMDEAERLCDRVGVMDQGRIIALDTPRALIASLGAEHLVEFAIAIEAALPEAAVWSGIEGVRGVTVNGGTVQLQVAELHRTVPAVLEELKRLDLPMTGLRTHSATLEDVFVSLTGRHLRDD